jgi:D-amino-acid dehydrogenase
MADPWNSPGCWKLLAASVASSDSPMQLRLKALPSLINWGMRFLWNSRVGAFERAARHNLELALASIAAMESLRQELPIDYGRSARGTLRLFRDARAFDRACQLADERGWPELSYRRLSANEAVELEPGLAPVSHDLAGAVHYAMDEVGNAHQFCRTLADHAAAKGVRFRFGQSVDLIETRNGRVSALICGGETLRGDAYVIAAGSYSTLLARTGGINLPVRPAKGYSITLPDRTDKPALGIPLVDDALHTVVVPLDGAVRVAGTAEFAGHDLELRPERVRNLLDLLGEMLPQATLDTAAAQPWCGLRAMSVDGVPIIGLTPLANLFVNTGHGHLGWTMAASSARLLTDLITGAKPILDPAPYALGRF